MTRSDAISTSFLLSSSARSMPNCFLPFSPLLGDRQHLDLYKFLVVNGKGGYDAICTRKLWDSVREEYGLDVSVGSSVKLV